MFFFLLNCHTTSSISQNCYGRKEKLNWKKMMFVNYENFFSKLKKIEVRLDPNVNVSNDQ